MDPLKSPNKKKSALGTLLNEKVMKSPIFVSPVLQQVGKLAASVASVGELSSQGSATGNPRNKCALQPGHSLMDWIRLGASGKDLTGLGPQAGQLLVTKRELSQHNKVDDIWLSIRGRVYNVTAYLPFHPGGLEELMKAAGIDATRLFDQVHPWVNYEQILQKCIVGKLVAIDPQINTEQLFFGPSVANEVTTDEMVEPSETQTTDNVEPFSTLETSNKEVLDSSTKKLEVIIQDSKIVDEEEEETEPKIVLPRFDWIQRLDYITAIFYTGQFSNPLIEIYPPNKQREMYICITSCGIIYRNELTFHEDVQWPCRTNVFWETGKIEICFTKTKSQVWENYGRLTQSSMPVSSSNIKFDFLLKEKKEVNHNIYLLRYERCDGCRMVVPIGQHLRLFVHVDGQQMSRSYTPVPSSLFKSILQNDHSPDEICLMIKKYATGGVSAEVTNKEIDDSIYLTRPLGDFDLKGMEKRDLFLLLAAGTGITPMISLLLFLLDRRIKKCQFARLFFFNRKEEDIPFRYQFDLLEGKDDRLKVYYILSEPETDWNGLTGHINKEMIDNVIQNYIKDTGYTIKDFFFFVCGPNQFVSLSLEELRALDIQTDQIHVFSG